jgi:hypothetical protein
MPNPAQRLRAPDAKATARGPSKAMVLLGGRRSTGSGVRKRVRAGRAAAASAGPSGPPDLTAYPVDFRGLQWTLVELIDRSLGSTKFVSMNDSIPWDRRI